MIKSVIKFAEIVFSRKTYVKIIKVAFVGSEFSRALISTQFLSMCYVHTLLNINRRGRKLFKVIDRKLFVLGITKLNVPIAQVKRSTKI